MKFIDLFAGVGGFHYGLTTESRQSKQMGSRRQSSNPTGDGENEQCPKNFECVYSNEWDKYANSVYRKHFGECDQTDIRQVKASDIPDHDLLCGGFPCQSFSVAGKRGGFNDTRGTLFFEIARILKQKQPRLCLLENVKGLLSHDQGRTFSTIITTLDELGYDCQWQVLNSKNFGVPQNRERVFIVGHLRGTRRPEVFPFRENDPSIAPEDYRQLSQTQVVGTIDSSYYKNHGDGIYIKQINQPTHSNDRVYAEDGISPTLNTMQGGMRQPKVMRTPLKFLQRNQKNIEGDYAYTVDSVNTGGIKEDMKIRRLMPVECERLQGFPDNWTKYGTDGELISDTQRYKMMGNAVTTNVITAIAERLI